MYELEETRILQDERDHRPPPYAVRRRFISKPVPTPPTMPERETTPVAEKAAQTAQPEMAEKPDEKALIGLDAVDQSAQPVCNIEKDAESSRGQETVPEVKPPSPPTRPVRLGAASELYMPMPQAARPALPQILQDEALLSPSTASSVLSSPQLLGASEIGDDDIISLSGVSNNTASYVDAETYTPRTLSPMSPSDFSVVSSRAISPDPQGYSLGMAQVLTQSSAGWDSESVRSDSDWEVLSNRR